MWKVWNSYQILFQDQSHICHKIPGGSSIIGEDLSQEDIVTSVKEAIRLNACALAMSIFVGSKYEHKSIVNLGKLVNKAEEYGIPVLAVTAVGKEMQEILDIFH